MTQPEPDATMLLDSDGQPPEDWEQSFDELVELEGAARERRLAEMERDDAHRGRFLRALLRADEESSGHLVSAFDRHLPDLLARASAAPGLPGDAAQPAYGRGDRVGQYRLLSMLGRGGMGEVWLAERADGELETRAAVKLIRPELVSERTQQRFLRERHILSQLTHPGIARLLDAGRTETGDPYFVLEYVEGWPITQWCHQRSASLDTTLELLAEVCDAVDHAHRALVVHRDLKPSNVLVDAEGRPKLLDFGIARTVSGRAVKGESTGGFVASAMTPAYAAPELLFGRPLTIAADVYSLGVLLYELLTGTRPHARTGMIGAIANATEAGPIEPPSQRLRSLQRTRKETPGFAPERIAGDLDAIAEKALTSDPEKRYPTASALADDLRRTLAHHPVTARAGGPAYVLSRFVLRHRFGVAAAACALLALVAALAVALWQTGAARTQALRAERVSGYLASVFETSDPEHARGGAMTARELLTEGAARIKRDLADEPEVGGDLLRLMATIHRKLGLLAEARDLAQRAVDTHLDLYGAHSLEAAKSQVVLGWVLLDQGEVPAALGLLRDAIHDLEAAGGQDLAVADAQEPLVEAIFAREGPEASLPLIEARYAAYRSRLGDRHEKTALALNDRGVALRELERWDEAEHDLRAALATLDELLPETDPRRAFPHYNLAGLLEGRGRYPEAEQELKRALELRRGALGEHHPETALTEATLAQIRLILGESESAEELARSAMATLTGVDAYNASVARISLADILVASGRDAEALGLIDRSIADLAGLVEPSHPNLITARVERCRALVHLGRMSEALPALDELQDELEAGDAPRANLPAVFEMKAIAFRGLGREEEAAAASARQHALEAERMAAGAAAPLGTAAAERH